MSDTTEALETELAQHIEGVMYADDIPEGTDYLPGTDTPIPDDYERRYCEVDGEDWPCLTRRAADALAAARTENEQLTTEVTYLRGTQGGYEAALCAAHRREDKRIAQRDAARAALAEANRKLEALGAVVESVLVEGSWIPVKEWPTILGNFMRDNDALGREAKGYAAEIDRLTKERLHAELHREEERRSAEPTGGNTDV